MTNSAADRDIPVTDALRQWMAETDVDGLDRIEQIVCDATAVEGVAAVHEGSGYFAERVIRRAIEQGKLIPTEYASALQASPPVGGDLVERAEVAIQLIADGNFYDDYDQSTAALGDLRALLAALSTPKVKEASVGEGLCPSCRQPLQLVANGRPDDLVRCECTVVALEWLKIAAALSPQPATRGVDVEAAREAFLNMIADARDWHDEPDGDETGDHTTFHLITHWSQMADLCIALGIKRPGYMETWADAIDRAVASPAIATIAPQLDVREADDDAA
jgi:hypothetical protein